MLAGEKGHNSSSKLNVTLLSYMHGCISQHLQTAGMGAYQPGNGPPMACLCSSQHSLVIRDSASW